MADYTVHSSLAERFGPIVIDLRQRRKPIDERWVAFYAAWRGAQTRQFFRSEIFQHYLPAARRAVEKFVKRGAQMLVPSSEFFEVYPTAENQPGEDERAQAVQSYLSYIWAKRIKIYGFARKLFRHYAMYGRAITKSGVEVVSFTVQNRRRQPEQYTQVWPTARIVDPYMFFSYPETQSDLDLSTLIVEDNMMPFDAYKKMAANPKTGVAPIDDADLQAPVWPEYSTRRLQQQQLTEPTSLTTGRDTANRPVDGALPPDVARFVALSEVWWREDGQWQMCWLAWNVRPAAGGGAQYSTADRSGPSPVCVRRAKGRPRHPYRMAVDREMVGEAYTTGMMDDLEPLNVLVNDQINLTLEGQATQFSPPAVIDPDLVSRPSSLVFRPRAKWFMKPDGVKWLQPEDTTDAGYKGIGFTLGLIDQYSGAGGMAEGQPLRNMPRAGFAVSSMMNVAMSDTKDAAQMIEDQILTPLTSDLYRLSREYVPPDQIIRLPGAAGYPAQQLSAGDLWGDFEFKWVGSLQSQDYQVRAQRLSAFLNIMSKLAPTLTQQLQLEGKTVDWEYLFRRVWRDGMGERGLGSVIRRYTPEERQQVESMMERQAAAAQKPPTRISLTGQLDPFTAKALSEDATPVPIETLHQAGMKGQKAGPPSPQGSATPASGEDFDRMMGGQMSAGFGDG